MSILSRSLIFALPAALAASTATIAQVDLRITPSALSAQLGEEIEVQLVVSGVSGGDTFDAMDAIVTWDPTRLELIGSSQSGAGASFFATGFLPDPDDVNDFLDDGDAIFTALAPPGSPVNVPLAPDEIVVTTLTFQALTAGPPAELAVVAGIGEYGETRVLRGGQNVTGNATSTAVIGIGTAGCAADLDGSGTVAFDDLVILLGSWGPCPGCPADTDGSGSVDFDDLVSLLAAWGPCPD